MSEFIKAIGIFYKNELNAINTYLVNQPTKTMPNQNSLIAALPLLALVAQYRIEANDKIHG